MDMVPEVRPFILDHDMSTVLALFERGASAGMAELMDEDTLRALMARSGAEPERDAVVVDDRDGGVMGWAALYFVPGAQQAELMLAADPEVDERCRGALLDAMVDRARELGASSLLAYVTPADTATLAFLGSRGAQPVAGYLRMRGAFASLNPAPSLPAGWQLVPCSGAGGAELALAAVSAAWGDLPGHKLATQESVVEALEVFGPDGHLAVLDAKEQVVGVVRFLMLESGEGYVDAPGLAPDVRSRGAYAALLGLAVSRLIDLGASHATLESWGDPPEARQAKVGLGWVVEAEAEGRLISVAGSGPGVDC